MVKKITDIPQVDFTELNSKADYIVVQTHDTKPYKTVNRVNAADMANFIKSTISDEYNERLVAFEGVVNGINQSIATLGGDAKSFPKGGEMGKISETIEAIAGSPSGEHGAVGSGLFPYGGAMGEYHDYAMKHFEMLQSGLVINDFYNATEKVPVLDEDGNPTYDSNGDIVYQTVNKYQSDKDGFVYSLKNDNDVALSKTFTIKGKDTVIKVPANDRIMLTKEQAKACGITIRSSATQGSGFWKFDNGMQVELVIGQADSSTPNGCVFPCIDLNKFTEIGNFIVSNTGGYYLFTNKPPVKRKLVFNLTNRAIDGINTEYICQTFSNRAGEEYVRYRVLSGNDVVWTAWTDCSRLVISEESTETTGAFTPILEADRSSSMIKTYNLQFR